MQIRQYAPHAIGAVCALVVLSLMVITKSRAVEEGVFVVLSGLDTVTIEQYRRRRGSLDIELVDRESLLRNSIQASLNAEGEVVKLDLQVHRLGAPGSVPPLRTVSLSVGRDTTSIEARMGGGSWAMRKIAGGADLHPYLDGSFVLMEEGVKHARTLGLDTMMFLWFAAESPGGNRARIQRKEDSVTIKLRDFELRLVTDPSGHILGGSIPPRFLQIQHAYKPFKARDADPEPDYAVPLDAPYTGEEVIVATADGDTLVGTLTRPKIGPSRAPAVILISGGGPQDRNSAEPTSPSGYRGFQQIADTLGRREVAVLRLDDRGTGASTGDPASTTSELYAKDIHAAVELLWRHPHIDARRIGLLGHSEGGSVAAMIAAKDTRIRGIVLLGAPARVGKQVMIEQSQWLAAHDTLLSGSRRDSVLAATIAEYDIDSAAARVRAALLRDLRAVLEHGVSASELDSIVAATASTTDFEALAMPASQRFFLRYDPIPTARRVRAPVLVLHGNSDRQVNIDQAAELASAFRQGGNTDVTVRVFRGLNHLFTEDSIGDPRNYRRLPSQRISTEVLGTLVDWLVEHL